MRLTSVVKNICIKKNDFGREKFNIPAGPCFSKYLVAVNSCKIQNMWCKFSFSFPRILPPSSVSGLCPMAVFIL